MALRLGREVRSSLKIIDSTYVLCLFDDYFPETNFDKNAYFDLLNAVSLKKYGLLLSGSTFKTQRIRIAEVIMVYLGGE